MPARLVAGVHAAAVASHALLRPELSLPPDVFGISPVEVLQGKGLQKAAGAPQVSRERGLQVELCEKLLSHARFLTKD